MSPVEQYLRELDGALHVRGRARRRLLAECRDHLADAGAAHGEAGAVARFGSATELARSFDTELAVRRALRATPATALGVLAVAWSTLALLHAADPHASAVLGWAVIFFGCAQTSAVSMLLATLRAAGMRNRPAAPADVALLCRRNGSALAFALVTLFAAGAARPGHGSAFQLLLGPAVAVPAAFLVLRTRSLARQLDAYGRRTVRTPWADLRAVAHLPAAAGRVLDLSMPPVMLTAGTVLAATAAFVWGHADDHGNLASGLAAAGIETALTVLGFLLLGPALGLWSARTPRRGRLAA
jgi:hypothetical protein